MSLDRMALAGFPYPVAFDTLCEAVFFPFRGLSRVSFKCLPCIIHAELVGLKKIISDDSLFSLSLADRRATARTTNRCAMQLSDKKIIGPDNPTCYQLL